MTKKKWRISFRYIPPYDYMTPLMYIPIEETIIEAESADEAWRMFLDKSLRFPGQSQAPAGGLPSGESQNGRFLG